MASNAFLKSQPPCCPPSLGPQSIASGKKWVLAIALKHGHLGQKDRGSSHGPQASAHSLGAIHQATGLVIQGEICVEWNEADVEGLESAVTNCNIETTGAWNGDSEGAQT